MHARRHAVCGTRAHALTHPHTHSRLSPPCMRAPPQAARSSCAPAPCTRPTFCSCRAWGPRRRCGSRASKWWRTRRGWGRTCRCVRGRARSPGAAASARGLCTCVLTCTHTHTHPLACTHTHARARAGPPRNSVGGAHRPQVRRPRPHQPDLRQEDQHPAGRGAAVRAAQDGAAGHHGLRPRRVRVHDRWVREDFMDLSLKFRPKFGQQTHDTGACVSSVGVHIRGRHATAQWLVPSLVLRCVRGRRQGRARPADALCAGGVAGR